jgi:hypothetical protein
LRPVRVSQKNPVKNFWFLKKGCKGSSRCKSEPRVGLSPVYKKKGCSVAGKYLPFFNFTQGSLVFFLRPYR